MANVIFYEKPGCINNTKQKALLRAAGHKVEARNLLTQKWTKSALRAFFGDLPVVAWFNPSAPQIKSGEINPNSISEENALDLMVKNPLLIRRPLIQVGERKIVGFETDTKADWIGLQPIDEQQKPLWESLIGQDIQTCPNQDKSEHETCKV